jgi:hypothetical protein
MILIGIHYYQAVIAAGASLSAAVPMGVDTLVGVSMPAATWTPAQLTLQVSPDGGTTWLELYDGTGNPIAIQGAAGQQIMLTSNLFRSINMFKIRSGTLVAPVVQSAGATITLIGRPEQI